jgi:hypothetical protein
MSQSENTKLHEAVKLVISKVKRFQDRSLGEQNTKASLVEPILEALGWDVRDPDEVHREFKPTTRDSPVDYALSILRKPRLFVEAKGLGETLSDRKWIAQVLGYATVAGVEWCVLSDGDEYRLYNATAPLDAEEKLFCSVRLSADSVDEIVRTLVLISRRNMEENILDVRWIAHYVDRRVKKTLHDMFGSTDRSLVRLIRQREPKLNPKEIVESLRRLDIRIESATPILESLSSKRKPLQSEGQLLSSPRPKKSNLTTAKGKRANFAIPLVELIKAGKLSTPLKLFRKYKGRTLEAVLYADGNVEFQGNRYPTCSTAAEMARSVVTGRKMNTNGWSFWQFSDGRGKKITLFDVREKYIASKASEPENM